MIFKPSIAKPNEPRIAVLVETVLRALVPLDFGAQVSYTDLQRVLFEDPRESRGRAAVMRAGKILLQDHRKLLVNVRGKGYQIAYPNEHTATSKRQVAAGTRRYQRALAIVVHTELERLSPLERQQVEEQANRVRLQLALMKKLGRTKALPRAAEVAMPTGKQLVGLLSRKKA